MDEINELYERCKGAFDNAVETIFDPKEPNHIIHYTSMEGLMGILQSGEMWFTESKFLNDDSEGTYIYEIIDKCDKAKYEKKFQDVLNRLILGKELQPKDLKVRNIINDLETRQFICSFSLEADSLPLWNYYTKNKLSVGYNIEISFKKLARIFLKNKKFHIIYAPVLYDYETQIKTMQSFLDSLNLIWIEAENDIKGALIYRLKQYIEILKCVFKHSAFSNEAEGRFILIMNKGQYEKCLTQKNGEVKIRVLNGLFVPYIALSIGSFNKIESISISPTLRDEKALESLEIIKQKFRLKNCKIKKSRIPLKY